MFSYQQGKEVALHEQIREITERLGHYPLPQNWQLMSIKESFKRTNTNLQCFFSAQPQQQVQRQWHLRWRLRSRSALKPYLQTTTGSDLTLFFFFFSLTTLEHSLPRSSLSLGIYAWYHCKVLKKHQMPHHFFALVSKRIYQEQPPQEKDKPPFKRMWPFHLQQ